MDRRRHPSTRALIRYAPAWIFFLFAIPHTSRADVVSRLGDIYFYDALLFDAGVLQRGGQMIGRLTPRGGILVTALDLPFYQEFSLRLEASRALPLSPDLLGDEIASLRWRIRMPILELARHARLRSIQINYAGGYGWDALPTFSPKHELNIAWSFFKRHDGMALTRHLQLGMAVREPLDDSSHVALGRLGALIRTAWLIQLIDPDPGPAGAWTMTLSAMEISAIHYGISAQGGEGLVEVAPAAPALHFTPRRATYTLGILPTTTWIFGPDRSEQYWSIAITFSVFYRNEFD